jgi:hypothetical protein
MSRHVHRALRWYALAACVLGAAFAAAPAQAARGERGGEARQVRMNQIQTINTHNSYKRELSPQEEAAHDALAGSVGAYDGGSAYSHVTLGRQFARQDVRGIELDLWPDPQGGLYAHPLVRKHLGLGPLPDPAWQQPGFKVLHVADADYNSSCVQFTTCLRQVKTWSDANPNHVPLFVMLELKQSSRAWIDRGGVVAPAWDLGQFERVDAEIRSVFRKHELIVPDDVRRPGLTVEQSITKHGWPTLEEARGRVMFFFNNVGSSSPYSEGRPNLEGRLAFVNAAPGNPNSAYHGRDEVLELFPLIQDLVSRNYLIRTRSDISLSTVRAGDMRPVQAALASGAQLISTDFPSEGMSGRYGTDFAVQLPEGLPARCNPVNAPPRCRSDRLEQPSAGKSRR